MTKTWVVNLKHKEPYDIYIGRAVRYRPDLIPLGWGNPYGHWNSNDPIRDFRQHFIVDRERLRQLKGKRLGCWCAPKGGIGGDFNGHICHGQILAALADALEEETDG